ncbi:hypothetical protein XENTR_v10010075 [Xenopus tropicalis]|nr:hypothetical protein XENTR_v10010075 [Xenopus tropicalis]
MLGMESVHVTCQNGIPSAAVLGIAASAWVVAPSAQRLHSWPPRATTCSEKILFKCATSAESEASWDRSSELSEAAGGTPSWLWGIHRPRGQGGGCCGNPVGVSGAKPPVSLGTCIMLCVPSSPGTPPLNLSLCGRLL